jgi:hypothetical protein
MTDLKWMTDEVLINRQSRHCIPLLEMTDLNKTTIVVVISGVVEIATPLRRSQ